MISERSHPLAKGSLCHWNNCVLTGKVFQLSWMQIDRLDYRFLALPV